MPLGFWRHISLADTPMIAAVTIPSRPVTGHLLPVTTLINAVTARWGEYLKSHRDLVRCVSMTTENRRVWFQQV